MEKIKVIIIEDDRFTRRVVELIITNHFPEFEIVGQSGSVKEGMQIILKTNPDLVILDVQLEDGNAFDLLNILKPLSFKIVFMSSFQSYMEAAVQFAAVDFLKKPFDESDLVMALDKAIETLKDVEYPQRLEVMFSNINQTSDEQTILFPKENGFTTVPVNQIIYGEAKTGGSSFWLANGESLNVPRPLRRYETLLTAYGFFRCHPLFLINLRMIENIDTTSGSILLKSGAPVPFDNWRKQNLITQHNKVLAVHPQN
jgi:two-component system, LytTR family, response regulator